MAKRLLSFIIIFLVIQIIMIPCFFVFDSKIDAFFKADFVFLLMCIAAWVLCELFIKFDF